MHLFIVILLLLASVPLGAQTPPAEGWTLHGRDLGGQRHATLASIDTTNVARLTAAWSWHSGVRATFQTTPIVVDTVMYVSLPFSSVAALDARTGTELWRYRHESRLQKLCCGPANRGVAESNGLVYVGTVDGRLVALDAATGAVRWDVTVAEYAGTTEATSQLRQDDPMAKAGATGSTGVGIGAAPLVHDGKVFVGINGVGYGLHPDQGLAVVGVAGQYGRPGLMAAFDAKTGAPVWQWNATGPKWEGAFRPTTPDGVPLHRDIAAERRALKAHADAWKFGGGSVYATPVVDAERRLLIFGTGNPSPQMADASRPGDNLHTSSLVALDLRTGRLVWHYQQVPHDRWGYDVASSPVLLDVQVRGKWLPAVAHCCSSRSRSCRSETSSRPRSRTPAWWWRRASRAGPTGRRRRTTRRGGSSWWARCTCRRATSPTSRSGPTAACSSTPARRTPTSGAAPSRHSTSPTAGACAGR
jgi:glucose dehydrogenase